MNFYDEDTEKLKKDHFLDHFNSASQLRAWVYTYLDLLLPDSHIDPESNSSPIEAMWDVYNTYKLNKGNEITGYIWLSSRDSYKTLSESILNVILMLHFGATIAHIAAITSQASKAISYVNGFMKKLKPYLDANGLKLDTQSKSMLKVDKDTGREAYVQVIVATVQGANSAHTNILSVDELEVMRFPSAYEEAKFIPGVEAGQYPLTIKTSTRKYAFGLMNKELENAANAGEEIRRWNILDVTEHCPTTRHKPETTVTRYVGQKLPLKQVSEEEFKAMTSQEQNTFDKVEAFGGCVGCSLLPVCKTRLAKRSPKDVGGLYKPIDFTIGQFRKTSPDMAEAQLLCWRPSTKGLVYPRFVDGVNGNVISLDEAYLQVTGEVRKDVSMLELTEALHKQECTLYGGVDWGSTHPAAAVIFAVLPGGSTLGIHAFAMSELEIHEFVEHLVELQIKFKVSKWFCDSSAPASIKTFKRLGRDAGVRVVHFTKDIQGGIDAIRGQILTSTGVRKLKIVRTPETEMLITGFKVHHFLLDAAGNPTRKPDDEEYADIMDCVRYLGQNLYGTPGTKPMVAETEAKPPKPTAEEWKQEADRQNTHLMRQQIAQRVGQNVDFTQEKATQSKKKKFSWDF